MDTCRVFLGSVICLFIIYLASGKPKERFELAANEDEVYVNKSDKPWEHHPIRSVAIDLKTTNDTAYYYELDNAEYDLAITKTFQYPCSKAPQFVNDSEWRIIKLGSDVRTAYDELIKFIINRLNVSDYMKLPSDNPNKRPKIQVVHDVLVQAKGHVTIPFKYIIQMEMILYREAKYHGKHVRVSAIVEYDKRKKKWNCIVLEANVLGIVYEDNIGLFPVVATYETMYDGRPYATLEKDERITPIDAQKVVDKQNKLQAQSAATTASLAL